MSEAFLQIERDGLAQLVKEQGDRIRELETTLSIERHNLAISEYQCRELEAALLNLALATSKYRAATDHHLGWTNEHPHMKPLLKAMLEARAALNTQTGQVRDPAPSSSGPAPTATVNRR
jgi:hypothetical protein